MAALRPPKDAEAWLLLPGLPGFFFRNNSIGVEPRHVKPVFRSLHWASLKGCGESALAQGPIILNEHYDG